jgi:hypothetical protein
LLLVRGHRNLEFWTSQAGHDAASIILDMEVWRSVIS